VRLTLELPPWVETLAHPGRSYPTDAERMQITIALARENVRCGAGGPFGAAVFEEPSGRLLAAGVNSVERLRNSVLHAEVLALMCAEAQVGSWTLRSARRTRVLVTSCDPCAMCLGAALWSGVGRIVCGADRDDAAAIGFEEGPVFPESWRFLAARGIGVTRGLLRNEARAVIELYRTSGGTIYNG
jgi:tRNA(Arg) A34 adenosine deaminase TadA